MASSPVLGMESDATNYKSQRIIATELK